MQKLSLSRTVIRKVNDGSFKIYNNKDDKYCTYKLLKHAMDKHLVPAMNTFSGSDKSAFKFFRCAACNKELKMYKSKGYTFKCSLHDHWGQQYFNVIVQKVASLCKFVPDKKYTARTMRHHGISTMANSDVNFSHKIVTNTTRHSTNAIVLYGKTDNAMHKLRSDVLEGM